MANINVNKNVTEQENTTATGQEATAAAKEEPKVKSYLTLDDILGRDTSELTTLPVDEYETERLGTIPFTAINHNEFKQAKKYCVKITPDGSGGVKTETDDDTLMVKLIVLAVDKDTRSDFTFANKALLQKLGVFTAEGAVGKLLLPGEIVNFAVKIQNASGFSKKKQKEDSEAIKNS